MSLDRFMAASAIRSSSHSSQLHAPQLILTSPELENEVDDHSDDQAPEGQEAEGVEQLVQSEAALMFEFHVQLAFSMSSKTPAHSWATSAANASGRQCSAIFLRSNRITPPMGRPAR